MASHCKIVPARNKKGQGISFSILSSAGNWLCVPHCTYFGSNKKEPKPKICPMFDVKVYKPKKKKAK